MKPDDFSMITAVGVLVAALVAFLAGVGVTVPLWLPASVPLLVGVVLFGLRAYVAYVGENNTLIDEKLAIAAELISTARRGLKK